MIQYLKNWLKTRKEKTLKEQQWDLELKINVDFRDENLYLICNGVAVSKFALDNSVAEVIDKVKNARESAVKYEGGNV